MTMPIQQYYAASVYSAAQLTAADVAAGGPDAMQLCLALNRGRGPGNGSAFFNGAEIIITNAGRTSQLVCQPGNWIVMDASGYMDVHADADFQASYVLKA